MSTALLRKNKNKRQLSWIQGFCVFIGVYISIASANKVWCLLLSVLHPFSRRSDWLSTSTLVCPQNCSWMTKRDDTDIRNQLTHSFRSVIKTIIFPIHLYVKVKISCGFFGSKYQLPFHSALRDFPIRLFYALQRTKWKSLMSKCLRLISNKNAQSVLIRPKYHYSFFFYARFKPKSQRDVGLCGWRTF